MPRFTRLDGLLGNAVTFDTGEENRHFYFGTGDPNVFSFTGLPTPKLGDVFFSDGSLYIFNGATWDVLQSAVPSPPNFSFRVIDAGQTVEIPAGQQMIVHSCGELEGAMIMEGQMILER